MSDAVIASVIGALCTFGGCLFGDWRGRTAERRAWCAWIRAQYRAKRDAKDAAQFRVEMMAKAHAVEKNGWKS